MKNIKFKQLIGSDFISGLIIENNIQANILPSCIFIHGGGTASYKERIIDFADPILKKNKNILSFDFSGHGESTGILSEGSLAKRIYEAEEIIKSYTSQQNLTLFGASMGGYIAIKLLEKFSVDTLILFCPALYAARAYNVPFNKGFSEIIREFESWRNTDALQILENFTGNLLIVMGENDIVIPQGVIDLIMHHTPKAKKKELYKIEQCSHHIHTWMQDHPDDLELLHQKIFEFV